MCLLFALPFLLLTPTVTSPIDDRCGEAPTASFVLAPDGTRLWIRVASTQSEQERGLMFQDHLPTDNGMLFTFTEATRVGFWMRDTPMPLSVAWLTRDQQVIEVQEMQPMSEQVHLSPQPYLYAVEANPTWFAAHRIRPGDHLRICQVNQGG